VVACVYLGRYIKCSTFTFFYLLRLAYVVTRYFLKCVFACTNSCFIVKRDNGKTHSFKFTAVENIDRLAIG